MLCHKIISLLLITVCAVNGLIDYEEMVAREVERDAIQVIQTAHRPSYDSRGLIFREEPLRSDYSPQELEFINGLRSLAHESKRGLISGSLKPKCYFENWTGVCCINLDVNLNKKTKAPAKTCVETGLRLTDMSAFAAVHFNDVELIEREYSIGKMCWGLPPPLRKLNACLFVYHAEVNTHRKSFQLCSVLEMTMFFHVGFNCIKFENGHFSISDNIQPKDKGIMNLSLVGGKLRFQVESSGIGKGVKYWFDKNWHRFAGLFRKKSIKFLEWLKKPFARST